MPDPAALYSATSFLQCGLEVNAISSPQQMPHIHHTRNFIAAAENEIATAPFECAVDTASTCPLAHEDRCLPGNLDKGIED
jgi:hypothetical protein